MIKKIEEMLINADPSSNIVVDNGFLIRCYNTNNLCTINMIERNQGIGYPEIIKSHIEKLSKININPCYRIVHDSNYEHLDKELIRNGFEVVERGAVMALRIENMERELFAFANFYEQGIMIDDMLTDEWIDDYRYMTRMDKEHGDLFESNLKKSLEDKMFLVLLQKDRLIAMGYVTFSGEYMIINNIYVDERYRNLDYGKRLLKAMLIKALLRGCKVALCEIREDQEDALKMIAQEGFERVYSYQYRGKTIF